MSEQRTTETDACWCGHVHEPQCPTCDKCGAPIETGLMALLCPGREECELWPEGGIAGDFATMFPDKYTPEEKARFRAHCEARRG